MTDKQPVPRKLWDRIQKFLATGANGQIVLDVHGGRVCAVSCTDRLKHQEDPIGPIETPESGGGGGGTQYQEIPGLKVR